MYAQLRFGSACHLCSLINLCYLYEEAVFIECVLKTDQIVQADLNLYETYRLVCRNNCVSENSVCVIAENKYSQFLDTIIF